MELKDFVIASAKIKYNAGIVFACHKEAPRATRHSGSCQRVGGPGYSRAGRQGRRGDRCRQCGLLGAALIEMLADLHQFKSLTGNAAYAPVECGLGASLAGIGKSRPRRAM
jgi:hypothetical protein